MPTYEVEATQTFHAQYDIEAEDEDVARELGMARLSEAVLDGELVPDEYITCEEKTEVSA